MKEDVIGKVFTSEVQAFEDILERDRPSESHAYFADRKVEDRPTNIHYRHNIDYVHNVLGGWQSFESWMQIQRPVIKVINKAGSSMPTV